MLKLMVGTPLPKRRISSLGSALPWMVKNLALNGGMIRKNVRSVRERFLPEIFKTQWRNLAVLTDPEMDRGIFFSEDKGKNERPSCNLLALLSVFGPKYVYIVGGIFSREDAG